MSDEMTAVDDLAPTQEWSDADREYMRQALELAERGRLTAMPNPCVACVIVNNGAVVARDYHRVAGEPHAEVLALRQAGDSAKGATVYVTLEPCSHTGRTPPCVDNLLECGVARVVAATLDANPEVNGRGLRALREGSVNAQWGLFAEQAQWQNRGFFTRMRRGRARVRIKLASSLDGRTALASGESAWITSAEARRDVQFWRASSGAMLTTANTVLADDPQLNVRLSEKELDVKTVRQPLRVVIDSQLRTSPDARIYHSTTGDDVVVAHLESAADKAAAFTDAGIATWSFDGARVPLDALLERLAKNEINDVQVEAGAELCGALIRQSLYDELLIYTAPCLLGEGGLPLVKIGDLNTMRERLNLRMKELKTVGDNTRMLLVPQEEECQLSS